MIRRDYYYNLAKKKGYKSRAAFKLMQINEKYHIIKKGAYVLDLGSSPGGWSRVAREIVGERGIVVSVDIQPMNVDGVIFIRGDIFSQDIIGKIKEKAQYFDVVISDMAPKLSGVSSVDHARAIELGERALEISKSMLKSGGNLVVKTFQGDMLNNFLKELRENFHFVKLYKPKASQPKSSEIYVVCKRFKFSSTP